MPQAEYIIQTEHTSGNTAKHYHGVSISTLNDWAKNNIPSNAVVSSIQVYYRGKLSLGDTVFYVGFSKNSSTEPGYELINSSLTTSPKEWYGNIPTFSSTYPFNITSPSSSYSVISVYMNSGIIYKKFTCYSFKVIYTYSIPTYTLTVNAGTGGTASGGGTYQVGTTATITANPNTGYTFAKWSDGNRQNPRTVTVTGDATYTAEFKTDIQVTYDNIFNFKKWAGNNLTSWTLMNISNVTDIGFTGQALGDDAFTQESRPLISVEAGKNYILEVDVETNVGFQLYVFYCDVNGAWGNLAYGINENRVYFTPTTNYISIRCDIDGTGNVATFSNFRIYPADCPYMSSTLAATERINTNSWSMPTPKRLGYTFKGWNTKPDGTGITYTSSDPYPNADTVLYSQWQPIPFEVTVESYEGLNGVKATVSGGGQYKFGDTITIKADIPSYHKFDGWQCFSYGGAFRYEENPLVVTLNENFIDDGDTKGRVNFFCYLEFTGYTLKASVIPDNLGSVYWGYMMSIDGTEKYYRQNEVPDEGIQVYDDADPKLDNLLLEAVPNKGYTFVQWSDANKENPRKVNLTGDATFTAEFAAQTCEVSIYCPEEWYGSKATVSGSNPGTYKFGDTLTLKADVPPNHKFDYWYIDPIGIEFYDNPITFTINEEFLIGSEKKLPSRIAIRCQIKVTSFEVKANVLPEEAGIVEWGLYNYLDTTEPYFVSQGQVPNAGVYVTKSYLDRFAVFAKPNEGYTFVQWSNGKTANPLQPILTSDTIFTAIFKQNKINNIYAGTTQPSDIYVGTDKVKEVYVGTTKVYG